MNALLYIPRWLDRNIERMLILFAYSAMALIIVFAVFERFVFQTQIPWSSSIPIYLFLWVTWIGCSHNVRKRSHLVFNDIRTRLSYKLQYACMWLDCILWWGFGVIVIYYTWEQTMLTKMNWATVLGTDDMMQWWFYMATPFAWCLLLFRAAQNLWEDHKRFRNNEPFIVDIQSVGQD